MTELTDSVDSPLEPLDHDAFQLNHRIVAPEAMAPQPTFQELMSPQWGSADAMTLDARSPGLVNRQAWLDSAPAQLARGAALAPGPGLILPPPPGPRDLEPASATGLERPSSLLERFERSEWNGAQRGDSSYPGLAHGARPLAAHTAPALTELPSTDPFAGFIAPPPSFAQRWGAVTVIALAVIGVFALAAVAVWWVTNAAW